MQSVPSPTHLNLCRTNLHSELYLSMHNKNSMAPNTKFKGDGNVNFHDLISTYCVHALKYHSIPHKCV